MKKAYTSLAKYYDLLYQDKDYSTESEFIKKIVKERTPRAKSILDVGCGTGTHLNLLLDKFKILYGIDTNEEILKEAKKKSGQIKYIKAGMADFNLGRKFDVIVCLFSVFNYNLSKIEAEKTLQNIKKHLNKNGLTIFALYCPRNTEKQEKIHKGKINGVEVIKINQFVFDPKTKIETSDFWVTIKEKGEIKSFSEENHRYRIYEADEFSEMLREAGFTKIEVFDNFTNKPPSKKN